MTTDSTKILQNSTDLIIGPLRFKHSVQKIALQERKGVKILETTRSSNYFVVDSGESSHKGQIRFLFTGLDEINGGINGEGQSGLRALIALFKCCPIVSIENDYISNSWKIQDENYDIENYNKAKEFFEDVTHLNSEIAKQARNKSSIYSRDLVPSILNQEIIDDFNKNITQDTISVGINNARQNFMTYSFGSVVESFSEGYFRSNKSYSPYVPVALERIDIENVPDLVNTLQVTLTIARVDISCVFEDEILKYIDEERNAVAEPRSAYWLQKWIDQLLDSGQIPELTTNDFKTCQINWYAKDAIGKDIPRAVNSINLDIETTSNSKGILLSESCSIAHKFAYNKLLGKVYSFPSHMGVSGKSLSLDIVFNNQESDEEYSKFCKFKENSDLINKSKERFDRVFGWNIVTPVTKLLTNPKVEKEIKKPGECVFVPLNVNSNTSESPNMIDVSIDLLENNIKVFENNEIVLTSGGTEIDGLRKFYGGITKNERIFRLSLNIDQSQALKEITSNGEYYTDYVAFWPIERSLIDLKTDSKFGILNPDTLRACLIHKGLDPDKTITNALLATPLPVGSLIANRKVEIPDKLKNNLPILWRTFTGVNGKELEYYNLYIAVKNILNDHILYENINRDSFISELAEDITASFLGNRTSGIIGSSYTSKIFKKLYRSEIRFSDKFLDSLFKVIVDRAPKNSNLPYIYSLDGIHTSFYKLLAKYTLEKEQTEEEYRKEIKMNIKKQNSGSVFPDLLLPTYSQLFGVKWSSFAPTFDDIGSEAYVENRTEPVVDSEDTVSPAAWFYTKRMKPVLRSFAKASVEETQKISEVMSLSIPFNTEDIEDVKKAIKEKQRSIPGSSAYQIAENTLSEIISKSLENYSKSNPEGFREDLVRLSEKFKDKYYSGNSSVKIYIHHNGNYNLPRELTVAGLGAEIYRVTENRKLLMSDQLPRLDYDSVYVTPIDKEVRSHRHLKSNNEKLIASALDKIPDDQYGPERMFPAIKVYLVDKRGNDLVGDDSIFNISSVLSVDITMDKNDAPLAVIKLADPLYNLQSDYFDKRNTYRKEGEERVFASIKSADRDSFLKRYKLVQGRTIQIRMGYSSMAYNLPITFTGRITEIMPGDELVIVAQGWKAELINRQVSFYNDDSKNWGARDLAIQAITYANPEGFGELFPQHEASYILKNLNPASVDEIVSRSLENSQNIDLDNVGSRSITDKFNNWLVTSLGFRSLDKDNKGFDTRLKNIWYPDTKLYNNVFGLRSRFGVMPSWHNDSWIIPLQSAWDVLKEASRHAWNCIVDVVPYDTEATIFMGHPDQPYYYTRGYSYARKKYIEKNKQKAKDNRAVLNNLLKSFKGSKYYKNLSLLGANNELVNPGAGRIFFDLDEIRNKIDFSYFKSYMDLRAILDGNDLQYYRLIKREEMISKLNLSSIPAAKLDELKNLMPDVSIQRFLASYFFNIHLEAIQTYWPTVDRDVEELLSRDVQKTRLDLLERLKSGSSNKENQLKNIERQLMVAQNAANIDFTNRGVNLLNYAIGILEIAVNNLINDLPEETTRLNVFKERIIQVKAESRKNSNSPLAKSVTKNLISDLQSFIKSLLLDYSQNRSELSDSDLKPVDSEVEYTIVLFKAFVYFFTLHLLEDEQAQVEVAKFNEDTVLNPNMRVFRTHHFINDTHNIIKNNIVSTTREMWNTVVVEYPKPGSAESTVDTEEQLFRSGRINAGVEWVYYPKNEVTGVIGLQYHPGLTLSNKKIQVFTELNCQNPDLAAKLACNHLAEGIRKMYRGNLMLIGKNMKPHDRLIMADNYTRMSGPVEVESVVHHWNTEVGWITNITPEAVCDANPGAGILHTAILETTFQTVFNVIDTVSDVLTVALIIATLGGATPLALGSFSLTQGVKGVISRFVTGGLNGGIVNTLRAYRLGAKAALRAGQRDLKGLLAKDGARNIIKDIFIGLGGPASTMLKNEVLLGGAKWGAHIMYKSNIIPAFIESAGDVEQLPVILSPLMFNGNPFTAGIEAEDAIWSIAAFGAYYSAKEIQEAAGRLLEDFFGGEI